MKTYAEQKAIEIENMERLLKVAPKLNNGSGIYILTREENGFKYAYIGQAVSILQRLISHLSGFQHIDLSIKNHGLYSSENPCGWNINFFNCPKEELNVKEQEYILRLANKGYQLRNKTSGGQNDSKKSISETPTKGYQQGLKQGYENARKEVAHLFALHLDFRAKKEPPTVTQRKAIDKFSNFIKEKENENISNK